MHPTFTAVAPANAPLTATQIREELKRPVLPAGLRFALIRRPDRALEKPLAFTALSDLARTIHRDRAGAALELTNAPLRLLGQDESRPGVSVWTLGEDGLRHRYLGWAWLDGADRRALEAALLALAPAAARCAA